MGHSVRTSALANATTLNSVSAQLFSQAVVNAGCARSVCQRILKKMANTPHTSKMALLHRHLHQVRRAVMEYPRVQMLLLVIATTQRTMLSVLLQQLIAKVIVEGSSARNQQWCD